MSDWTLQDYVNIAKKYVDDNDGLSDMSLDDLISSAANNACPGDNSEVLTLALDNLWLATANPDVDYSSPLEGIQWNIIEYIEGELSDMRSEWEDDEDEDES